jgi:hypothetical protein
MAVEKKGKVNDRPFTPVPKPQGKPKGGKSPKQYGASVERAVAKTVGGHKTIGSGAFKNTNNNLTGDVEVYDNSNQPFLKLEVKARASQETKGEKTLTIAKSVLDQATKEADEAGEIGATWYHFKGEQTTHGWVVMSAKHFTQLVEWAKLGRPKQK